MLNIIEYSETFYTNVDAYTEDASPGITIPAGQAISTIRFRANGGPNIYVTLYWDFGGAEEKAIASTGNDIDIPFDKSSPDNIYIGDGSKKVQIVIENNSATQSQIVGGAVDVGFA